MATWFWVNLSLFLLTLLWMSRRYPHPALLVGVSVLAFAAFAWTLNVQEKTNPASRRPRAFNSPLNPSTTLVDETRHDASDRR